MAENNPTQKTKLALVPNPNAQPKLKEVAKLHHSEHDILGILQCAVTLHRVLAQNAQQMAKMYENNLNAYCNELIERHGLNPAENAISPDLKWIVRVPEEQIQAMAKAAAEAQKKTQPPPVDGEKDPPPTSDQSPPEATHPA